MSNNENLNAANNENPNIASQPELSTSGANTAPEASASVASNSSASEIKSGDSAKPEPRTGPEADPAGTRTEPTTAELLAAEAAAKEERLLPLYKNYHAALDDMLGHFQKSIEELKTRGKKGTKGQKKKRKMLTHGVYSDELILSWERAEDFDNLFEGFVQEWQPEGCSEKEAVVDLTHATWLKRRAQKMPQLTYQRHPFALAENRNWSWPDVIQMQKMTSATVMDPLVATTEMMGAMRVKIEIMDKIRHDVSTPEGKRAQQEMFALRHRATLLFDELENSVIPAIKLGMKTAKEAMETFNLAYDPDELSKQVRTEAAIQARIDKTIQRLIYLKEYKHTLASRVKALPRVSSPGIAASSAPDSVPTPSETGDTGPRADDAR